MLKDVSHLDLSTTILGHQIEFPICSAPFTMLEIGDDMTGYKGALAIAKGELRFL